MGRGLRAPLETRLFQDHPDDADDFRQTTPGIEKNQDIAHNRVGIRRPDPIAAGQAGLHALLQSNIAAQPLDLQPRSSRHFVDWIDGRGVWIRNTFLILQLVTVEIEAWP
jgi:hypothetical protein